MANTDNENAIAREEHNDTYGMKQIIWYGLTTGSDAVPVQVDSNGILQTS